MNAYLTAISSIPASADAAASAALVIDFGIEIGRIAPVVLLPRGVTLVSLW